MFNNLKRLLGLSSTPDSQPANSNPLGPPFIHGQSHPQSGNYMYWNGLSNYQGIIFATLDLKSPYVTQDTHIQCLGCLACIHKVTAR
jgi:hypothetical protein